MSRDSDLSPVLLGTHPIGRRLPFCLAPYRNPLSLPVNKYSVRLCTSMFLFCTFFDLFCSVGWCDMVFLYVSWFNVVFLADLRNEVIHSTGVLLGDRGFAER